MVLGAKGSVRDRLRLTGGLRAPALGSYIESLRWRGDRPFGRHFYAAFGGENHTTALRARKCNPPLVAGATTLPGGKRVTGFSVAYGSLRIQFPCHYSVVGLWMFSHGAMSLQESIETYSAP